MKIKWIRITVLLALLLVWVPLVPVAVRAGEPTESPKTDISWETYVDHEWGYTIRYPRNWTVGVVFTNSEDSPPHVIRKRVRFSGSNHAEINVDVWQKSPDVGLMAWLDENQRTMLELGGVRIPGTSNAMLDGQASMILTQVGTCSSPPLFYAYVSARDRMFTIEYSAADEGNALDIYRQMVMSFSIGAERIQAEAAVYIPELSYPKQQTNRECYTRYSASCCDYISHSDKWACGTEVGTNKDYGNCVWWAAFKRPDVGDAIPRANAGQWATLADSAGFPVDRTPQVGDIVVNESNPGHVAYVTNVGATSVDITGMGWCRIGPPDCYETATYPIAGHRFIHRRGHDTTSRLDFRVRLYHSYRANHSAPITVRIRERGTNRLLYEAIATTNSDGWYAGMELPGVPSGRYDVIVKAPASISKRVSNVHFAAGTSTLVDFSNNWTMYLEGGDFNNDDKVNILDLSRVLSAFKTDNPLIDITGDGIVNIFDLSIVLSEWKRVGDDFANMQEQLGQAVVAQGRPAKLQLSPSSGTYNVGQEFNVQIHIDTGGATIDGVDAIIRYDPCALEVQNISDGTAFSEYPEQNAYPDLGEIGISGKGTFSGSGTLGTVRFRVVAGNTPSGVQIQFKPADTTDSNVAENGSSEEILGSVGSVVFSLTGTPSRPPLSGTFSPPDGSYLALMEIPVTLKLNDACAGVIAEEVDFDVYYDSAWHSLGVDRNRYNGWSTLWNTAAATDQDQIVSLRAIVTDTNGTATTVIAQNLTLDRVAPTSTLTAPVSLPPDGTFTVTWSGSDSLSGLASYDIQYKDSKDGLWIDWQSQTAETSAVFVGEEGHNYYFRVRARDVAGNVGAFSEERAVPSNQLKVYLPLILRDQ